MNTTNKIKASPRIVKTCDGYLRDRHETVRDRTERQRQVMRDSLEDKRRQCKMNKRLQSMDSEPCEANSLSQSKIPDFYKKSFEATHL